MAAKLIEILGIIGVGKSTLLSKFSDEIYKKIEEPVASNPYLEDFYAEMRNRETTLFRTVPLMEIYLQNKRFYELGMESNKVKVTDWGWPEVFAKMLFLDGIMNDRDYKTFLLVCENTRIKSDLVIFLDMAPKQALANIHNRGRDCEKSISLEYLKNLRKNYLEILSERKNAGQRVEIIDWDYDIKKIEQVLKSIELSLSPCVCLSPSLSFS